MIQLENSFGEIAAGLFQQPMFFGESFPGITAFSVLEIFEVAWLLKKITGLSFCVRSSFVKLFFVTIFFIKSYVYKNKGHRT